MPNDLLPWDILSTPRRGGGWRRAVAPSRRRRSWTAGPLRSSPESRHRAGYDGAKRKRGFVLLPRRWVVERSFAWATRFRQLVHDYERLPEILAGLHLVAFACLMLMHLATLEQVRNSL
jgi:transposase